MARSGQRHRPDEPARKRKASGAGKGKAGKGTGRKTPGGAEAALPAGATPPRKLYSSGEVVRASGISRQVLHNYTVLGLLQPVEVTDTNRRYYDERVFGRIRLVRRMLASGYRLTDLRETFRWED